MPPTTRIPAKKVTRSLSNLLKVEKDLKKNECGIKKSSKKSKNLGKRKF